LSGKQDGFWLLVTNHAERKGKAFEVKTEETIEPYREKKWLLLRFKVLLVEC